MKPLFNTDRLFRTFALYVVIIVIPLGIMYYLGLTTLEDKKHQVEESVYSELRQAGGQFYRDLLIQWQEFMEEETFRKFYHYQPLIIPDKDSYSSTSGGAQRSPLYHTIEQINNLECTDCELTSATTPSLEDILHNSLVGYFQYNPHDGAFITPYDPTEIFQNPVNPKVDEYRNFLYDELKASLVERLDLTDVSNFRPMAVLRHLKGHTTTKEKEPRSKLNELAALLYPDKKLNTSIDEEDGLVTIYYYDFNFYQLLWQNNSYIISFRPILIENQLLVQGFIINTLLFIQEAQGYLELLQPKHGNLVVGDGNPQFQAQPIFEPFNFLSIVFKPGDEKGYLKSYNEEKRRFYFTMIGLTVALVFSMMHLGSLIYGNIDLHRKKNNFISAITHELKAPLTSIIMYAEMLEEGWAQGKEKTYYQHIRWESERLSRLIRNILDYSGLERGTFKLQQAPISLDHFMQETQFAIQDWMDKSGLELKLIIEAEPMVYVDKDSLSQVVYNLCDNTIKYGMGHESPCLTVKVAELEENAILSIFDNGQGIAKEEEDKIFNRFYRVENEMTRESTGTGLGLALVKDLVEGNGGTIEYFRPEETGFGVRITFPKMDEAELFAGQEFA